MFNASAWTVNCEIQPFDIMVKMKDSSKRPGVAQRVLGGLGSQISMTFGTWRWWCCQPHAPTFFIPRKCSWYSFSLGLSRPQGHGTVGRNTCMSLKNPVTPPGIDPGTVRLVAQRLNHYATPGPIWYYVCTLQSRWKTGNHSLGQWRERKGKENGPREVPIFRPVISFCGAAPRRKSARQNTKQLTNCSNKFQACLPLFLPTIHPTNYDYK